MGLKGGPVCSDVSWVGLENSPDVLGDFAIRHEDGPVSCEDGPVGRKDDPVSREGVLLV